MSDIADHRTVDFATLIAPVSWTDFLETYWGRRPLHAPATNSARFSRLFSTVELNRLLAEYGRPSKLGVRLSKHHKGETEIVDLGIDEAPMDVSRVWGAYSNGFTVNLNDVQERHPAIRDLVISLADTFGCVVRANAYLTPSASQAFPLHFDTHDVLIVQIEGTKSWRLHSPLFPFPTVKHKPPHKLPPETADLLVLEVKLEAGDVLYMPRGFGHAVKTEDRASLHLTVGLHAYTFFDVAEAALNILGWDCSRLREAIPPGILRTGVPDNVLTREIEELRCLIAQRLPLEEGLRVLAGRELAERPVAHADVCGVNMDALGALQIDSRVRKHPGMPCRILKGSGWITLQYPSHAVTKELRMGSALEQIARSEEFVISSLTGHLTDDEKIFLVRQLVAEGLLLPLSNQQ